MLAEEKQPNIIKKTKIFMVDSPSGQWYGDGLKVIRWGK